MLSLDRDSKLVRFAYLGRVPEARSDGGRYDASKGGWVYGDINPKTSLCSIFWRTIGSIMIVGASAFMLVVALVFLSILIFHNAFRVLMVLGIVSILALFIWGIIQLLTRNSKRIKNFFNRVEVTMEAGVQKVVKSPFVQGGLSVKRKFCPIIELK